MKTVKKLAIFAAITFAGFAYAMEPVQLQSIIIEKYQPTQDRAQVEQILKDKWAQQVWGEQGKQFDPNLANTLLSLEDPAKSIAVAKDKTQPADAQIQGYVTYFFYPENPANADEMMRGRRGYIELLALKDMSPTPARKALETKLINYAIQEIRPNRADKVDTYTFINDDFEIDLLKGLGFKETKQGKLWRLFTLPINQ